MSKRLKLSLQVFGTIFLFLGLMSFSIFNLSHAVHADTEATPDSPESSTPTDDQATNELTDDERGAISTNCGSIIQSLKTLQRTDSKTRVLLGTTYQSLLTKYITPLNLRLTRANKPNAQLTKIQGDFIAAKDDFSTRFIKYSRELEKLIGIDCKTNPDDFYDQLKKTRTERQKLAGTVQKVNESISDHITIVRELAQPTKDKPDEK